MKNLDSLENQLRSWTPRPPSAKLGRRLFGSETPAGTSLLHRLHWNWQGAWGAALAACLVLVFTVANLSNVNFSPAPVPVTLASLSNVTSLAAAQHNSWTAPIFGWTNDRQLPSAKRSFDLLNTNHLLR